MAAMILRRMPSLVSAPGWVGALDRSLTLSVLFAALYLGAVVLLHRGCDPLRQIAALVGDMLPGRDRRGRGGVIRSGATAIGISR